MDRPNNDHVGHRFDDDGFFKKSNCFLRFSLSPWCLRSWLRARCDVLHEYLASRETPGWDVFALSHGAAALDRHRRTNLRCDSRFDEWRSGSSRVALAVYSRRRAVHFARFRNPDLSQEQTRRRQLAN